MFVLRSNPVRTLFWGLLGFSILMFFVAWGGIGSLFVPPTPSGEGVRFVDMPAPLLAINLALCFLPLASGLLILIGVSSMAVRIPRHAMPYPWNEREIMEELDRLRTVGRPSLTWRLNGIEVSASHVGLTLVLSAIALLVGIFVVAFVRIPGPPLVILGLSLAIVLSSIPIALGWYFMFLSGWALAPHATPREQRAILAAVSSSGLFAAVLIGAGFGATLALGPLALESSTVIPAPVPWAQASAGTAGFVALVVLTRLARRISRRYGATRTAASDRVS